MKKTKWNKKHAAKRREKACKLAAKVLAGVATHGDTLIPVGWSLAVFFENYMRKGARGTIKDFGPKEPVELRNLNMEGRDE